MAATVTATITAEAKVTAQPKRWTVGGLDRLDHLFSAVWGKGDDDHATEEMTSGLWHFSCVVSVPQSVQQMWTVLQRNGHYHLGTADHATKEMNGSRVRQLCSSL